LLARLLQAGGVSLIASPGELVQELTTWMMQEIDLKRELANLSRLYRLAAGSPYEKVPNAYPDLSTARVLTAEFLSGVPVSEILIALRSGRPEELKRVEELGGVDWKQFAANLVRSTLGQIFRYQFFHADLHPGNLLLLPGNVIGYVDFGLCDELDEIVRKEQLRYLTAVYSSDVEQMFKALTEIVIPSDRADIEGLRMDFMAETRTWLGRSAGREIDDASSPSRLDRSPIAQWMIGVMRATRRHEYRVPTRILSMYRALLTAETVASSLAPGMDLPLVGREFFAALALEEAFQSLEPRKWQPILLNALALWRDSPGQLRQIVADLAEGRLTVKVEVSETQKTVRTRGRRVRLLVTSILSVGVALLITKTHLPELFGVSLAWPLYLALAVLYISTYFQWRRLR
jgi:ubiquinone biosynthesis protein